MDSQENEGTDRQYKEKIQEGDELARECALDDKRIWLFVIMRSARKMLRMMTIVIGHLVQRKKDATRNETHHRNISVFLGPPVSEARA
jgi:hypothetical protein